MFIESRYSVAHSELACIEIGDKEAAEVTVVFIHGWLDNCGSFSTLIHECYRLMPHAHILAIDLPGHGLTTHRKEDNYYFFHDYIDDIHQLVSQLTAKKLVLVGHSLGAFLAGCYAAAFPENVNGLVQIEGFKPLTEDPYNAVTRLREGIVSRSKRRDKSPRFFYTIDEMVEIRSKVNKLTSQEAKPIVSRGSVFDGERWTWSHDPKLNTASLFRMTPESAEAVMLAICCPHLVILGESGFSVLPEQIENQRKKELYSSKTTDKMPLVLKTIPGGHHCHIQHTELTSELISGLVNKI